MEQDRDRSGEGLTDPSRQRARQHLRNDIEYRHLLEKCRDARDGGLSALSNGERIVAALALNRPDWLTQLDCTMAEAIDQIGLIRCSMLLQAQRELVD